MHRYRKKLRPDRSGFAGLGLLLASFGGITSASAQQCMETISVSGDAVPCCGETYIHSLHGANNQLLGNDTWNNLAYTLSSTGPTPPQLAGGRTSSANGVFLESLTGSGNHLYATFSYDPLTNTPAQTYEITLTGLTASGGTAPGVVVYRITGQAGGLLVYYRDTNGLGTTTITLAGTAKPNGTACSDANACTSGETCQSGSCGAPTATVTCAASDQCHEVGSCNPSTGLCSNPARTNGTPCNDGRSCTTDDACQSGTCVPAASTCACSSAADCPALSQCHLQGTCNVTTGQCNAVLKPEGSTCDDDNACTSGETCQSGACTQPTAVVMCPVAGACHKLGVCDVSDGRCTQPTEADGTACASGAGTCSAGVCSVGDAGSTLDGGPGALDAGLSDGGSHVEVGSGGGTGGGQEDLDGATGGNATQQPSDPAACGCGASEGGTSAAWVLFIIGLMIGLPRKAKAQGLKG